MSEIAVLEERIESLVRTVEQLASRVEDLEDNRDLEQAVADNAGQKLVPWEKAQPPLELD